MHAKKRFQKTYTQTILGIVFILINAILWGISPWVIKQGLRQISPAQFLFFRFLWVVALEIFIYAKYLKHIKQIVSNKILLFSAFLFNFVTLLLYFYGLDMLTPVQAGVIVGTTPLFVILPMVISKKEQLGINEIIGILFTIIGYIVVLLPSLSVENINLLGVFLLVLGNISFSIAVMINKMYLQDNLRQAYEYTSFLIALIGFGFVFILQNGVNAINNLFDLHLLFIWPVLYMAIGASIIAVAFFNLSAKYLEASETISFAYTQPLFLLLFEIFVLNVKSLDFVVGIGIMFMLLGMIINIFGILSNHKQLSNNKNLSN